MPFVLAEDAKSFNLSCWVNIIFCSVSSGSKMLLLQPEFMDFQGGVGILGTRKMQPGDVLEPPGHRGGCPCGHTGTEKSWCALHVSCWAQVSHATYLRARALTAQTGMEFGYPSISPYTKLLTFVQVNCKTQCMCCSSIIGASYGLYI